MTPPDYVENLAGLIVRMRSRRDRNECLHRIRGHHGQAVADKVEARARALFEARQRDTSPA